jgi:hypothetical protein
MHPILQEKKRNLFSFPPLLEVKKKPRPQELNGAASKEGSVLCFACGGMLPGVELPSSPDHRPLLPRIFPGTPPPLSLPE